jgi:asparagine synthase (glutamine-hydrolysing)
MIGLFALFLNKGRTDNYKFPENQCEDTGFLYNEIDGGTYYIRRRMLNKFPEDKLFFQDENIHVCIDGMFLNRGDMEKKYHEKIEGLIRKKYVNEELGAFVNEIRGSFSGFITDMNKQEICVFTDHLALKPVFYLLFENGIIAASEVYEIARFCRCNHIDIHLDFCGAYSMLTYGYMYENCTLIKEVKKLREGTILHYTNEKLFFETYHTIKNETITISEEDAVVKIEQLFRQALELEVKKNKQYNYENVIPLSAGMDCRMTSYAFKKMFNQHAVNFTYSETGEYDYTTSSKMASELNNRWIFKSLDNGLDLYSIDEAVKLSDGLIYYAWPAQLNDFLKLVNTRNWGVIHTGVLGDIVVGTFVKENSPAYYNLGDGAFSTKMIEKLKKYSCVKEKNYEIGMIQNRGINGACLGYALTFRHYAEDLSPFLNIDFFDFCLSIPIEMKQKHKLYYTWVERFYPEAKKYKHNGVSLKGSKTIKFQGKEYRICAIPDLLVNTIRSRIKSNYGMNPFQSWYDNNHELQEIMKKYYLENKHEIKEWKELYKDTKWLFVHGNAKEKIQVLSLLGSVKLMFREENT